MGAPEHFPFHGQLQPQDRAELWLWHSGITNQTQPKQSVQFLNISLLTEICPGSQVQKSDEGQGMKRQLVILANWRIVECFGLEGTFQCHLGQGPARSKVVFWVGLLRSSPSWTLKASKDGTLSPSLGSLKGSGHVHCEKLPYIQSKLALLQFKPSLLVLLQGQTTQ